MKSLQTLVIASLLVASATVAHASTTSTLSATTLSSEAYAQDATQDSSSHPLDRASLDRSGDPGTTHNDAGPPSGHLPGSNGKAVDSAPAESARAPSWQSLLPGSIQ